MTRARPASHVRHGPCAIPRIPSLYICRSFVICHFVSGFDVPARFLSTTHRVPVRFQTLQYTRPDERHGQSGPAATRVQATANRNRISARIKSFLRLLQTKYRAAPTSCATNETNTHDMTHVWSVQTMVHDQNEEEPVSPPPPSHARRPPGRLWSGALRHPSRMVVFQRGRAMDVTKAPARTPARLLGGLVASWGRCGAGSAPTPRRGRLSESVVAWPRRCQASVRAACPRG